MSSPAIPQRSTGRCAWLGCDHPTNSTLCIAHQNQRYNNGGAGHGNRRLTPEEKADIVRRVARFESPLSIAKFHGITTKTVHYTMRTRKAS